MPGIAHSDSSGAIKKMYDAYFEETNKKKKADLQWKLIRSVPTLINRLKKVKMSLASAEARIKDLTKSNPL